MNNIIDMNGLDTTKTVYYVLCENGCTLRANDISDVLDLWSCYYSKNGQLSGNSRDPKRKAKLVGRFG